MAWASALKADTEHSAHPPLSCEIGKTFVHQSHQPDSPRHVSTPLDVEFPAHPNRPGHTRPPSILSAVHAKNTPWLLAAVGVALWKEYYEADSCLASLSRCRFASKIHVAQVVRRGFVIGARGPIGSNIKGRKNNQYQVLSNQTSKQAFAGLEYCVSRYTLGTVDMRLSCCCNSCTRCTGDMRHLYGVICSDVHGLPLMQHIQVIKRLNFRKVP